MDWAFANRRSVTRNVFYYLAIIALQENGVLRAHRYSQPYCPRPDPFQGLAQLQTEMDQMVFIISRYSLFYLGVHLPK
jgi:hypothetical protein